MIDAIAREAGIEPHEVRMRTSCAPEQMPFDNITKKHFDSGDYPQVPAARGRGDRPRRGARAAGARRARRPADRGRPRGLLRAGGARHVGLCGLGHSAWCPGYEQATARLTPDGGLELRVGVQSHGQGMETTLAQVAHEMLGIDVATIKVMHGDTALTPYSTGTWGSRCMVMAGGAVGARMQGNRPARRARSARISCRPMPPRWRARRRAWSRPAAASRSRRSPHLVSAARRTCRADVDPGGLEVTVGYKPERDSGTFSYATHAAMVAVDPEIGNVEILDYVIVEDGGMLVNPMIVDGQVYRRRRAGDRHRALRGDAVRRDRPAAGLDLRRLSAARARPRCRRSASSTWRRRRRTREFGIKGIGEGGAIAPPAAIANAVNDALRPLGVEVTEIADHAAPASLGALAARPRRAAA